MGGGVTSLSPQPTFTLSQALPTTTTRPNVVYIPTSQPTSSHDNTSFPIFAAPCVCQATPILNSIITTPPISYSFFSAPTFIPVRTWYPTQWIGFDHCRTKMVEVICTKSFIAPTDHHRWHFNKTNNVIILYSSRLTKPKASSAHINPWLIEEQWGIYGGCFIVGT